MAFTKDIGLRDFYNTYKKVAIRKGIEYKDYQAFSRILKKINLKLRDKIIYNSEIVTLPYRLGDLGVKKFALEYTEENRKYWKVDFKASKEAGFTIYHGPSHGYQWRWFKKDCRVNGRKYYKFKPCRKASRLVAAALKSKQVDYYS